LLPPALLPLTERLEDHDSPQQGGLGAWWNVTNDPLPPGSRRSPLTAFMHERALNRLALRTKLPIADPHNGALAYLKHDALGPRGDACVIVYNPGAAQVVTVDLSALPPSMLSGSMTPHDLFVSEAEAGRSPTATSSHAPPALDASSHTPTPLAASWSVAMSAGEAAAFGGFSLGTFAPRRGKRASCAAADGYSERASATTLQACFLDCLARDRCHNVHVEYVDIRWMETPPRIVCTLLGEVLTPNTQCRPGTGTLVRKLVNGRPRGPNDPPATPPPPPRPPPLPRPPPPPSPPPETLDEYRTRLLRDGVTYRAAEVPPLGPLPMLTAANRAQHREWHEYIESVYGSAIDLSRTPIDLNRLTWFYWAAPVRLTRLLLCDWSDEQPEARLGTPWTGGVAAWAWGPEHLVRRKGFFVHRLPWPTDSPAWTWQATSTQPIDDDAHAAAVFPTRVTTYQGASRLEVQRIGPIYRGGFFEGERSEIWFFHAIGSGVFIKTSDFESIDARYERHMAVPRVELVGRLDLSSGSGGGGGLGSSATVWSRPSSAVDPAADPAVWWPEALRFELYDGTACASVSREARILSCSNLPMRTWSGDEPPPLQSALPNPTCSIDPVSDFMRLPLACFAGPPEQPPMPPRVPPCPPPPVPSPSPSSPGPLPPSSSPPSADALPPSVLSMTAAAVLVLLVLCFAACARLIWLPRARRQSTRKDDAKASGASASPATVTAAFNKLDTGHKAERCSSENEWLDVVELDAPIHVNSVEDSPRKKLLQIMTVRPLEWLQARRTRLLGWFKAQHKEVGAPCKERAQGGISDMDCEWQHSSFVE